MSDVEVIDFFGVYAKWRFDEKAGGWLFCSRPRCSFTTSHARSPVTSASFQRLKQEIMKHYTEAHGAVKVGR